jgi:hypothetical protein
MEDRKIARAYMRISVDAHNASGLLKMRHSKNAFPFGEISLANRPTMRDDTKIHRIEKSLANTIDPFKWRHRESATK